MSGTNSAASAPLDITNVQAASMTTSTAQIVWVTNVPADSAVDYGTTTSYGSSSPVDPTMVTSHQVTLSGLAAGTTYYYQVRSTDSNNNHGKSGGHKFTTAMVGFSISGTLTPTQGGSGATVMLSGTSSATTTANGSGAYTFTGLPSGSYTITPSNTGYTFTPPRQNVTLTTSNVTGVNFTAAATAVAPAIITQPPNQTVTAGQAATFTVAVTGTAPLSYQWQKNGANISGATSSSYTTPATTTADSGSTFDVVVSNSAGTAMSNAATLTVNPAPAPAIQTNPTSINFGNAVVGTNLSKALIISNAGTATLTITQVTPSGAAFSASGFTLPLNVSAGQQTMITVAFLPTTVGPVTGSLSIVSNAPTSPTSVSLSGSGTAATLTLGISPTSLNFGNVTTGTSSATQNVTITNTGNSNVTISQISVSGAGYTVTAASTPVTLTPSQNLVLGVQFSPAVAGSVSGTISIVSNATGSPATVTLSGTGVIQQQVSVSISPTSVSVQTGQSTQFTASVTGTTNTNVTWLVNGVSGGSAAIGTISSTGLYSAPSSVPSVDPVTVTAQSVFDPTKSANATVTIVAATACAGTCYYVSPTGSDSNPGTSAAPFQTIQHAAGIVNPGDTVIVEDGTYNGGCAALTQTVAVNRGGSPGNLVTFKSANKYGAKLDGGNICRDGWVIGNGVSYVRIQDFEITGYAASGGTWADAFQLDCGTCSNIDIVGNKIHDIGKICTDTANGQNGIFMNANSITVEQNSIYNIGRFAPGENGCNPSTNYYQNHDHGIYNDAGDQAKIQNNIFYNNVRGWSIQVYPGSSTNLLIINNTFSDPNPYRQGHILCWGTGTMSGHISNNIFYQPNTAAIWDQYCAGIIVNYNLSTNIDEYNQCGSSCASYANDLLNQNPATIMLSPDTDFHLILGSPAIGAGTSTNAPATDFNGKPRNNPPSIGAYESGSTP